MSVPVAVAWSPTFDAIRIIDQRLLPEREETVDLRTLEEVCHAIRTLAVRGAPAIGITGAMGLVVAAASRTNLDRDEFMVRLERDAAVLRATRPTAVNLGWALDRVLERARVGHSPPEETLGLMRAEATAILEEDRAMCSRIGDHGLPLVPDGSRVLTHCNAGALATGGIGTALAPIYRAVESGRKVSVIADETRPLLQGSRLTAWELQRAGVPVTVIADHMAAPLMRDGRVDLVIVGADRITIRGDVANKIGTYALAIAARHHGIPFYVAAPSSTFDVGMENGGEVVIEQRPAEEITCGFGVRTAPEGVGVENPAFDVTPAELVTAIISDLGVHHPPFDFSALLPSGTAATTRSRTAAVGA